MTRSKTDLKLSGWLTMSMEARTVADLHSLSRQLLERNVPGHWLIDYGSTHIIIESGDDMKAEWIECSDHVFDDLRYDVLLLTHDHVEDEQEPDHLAAFDWVGRDRYLSADEARP